MRYCAKYRDRGVLGVGLGGLEAEFPPELSVDAFQLARDLGLASVPHAGEVAGAPSVQGAIESLHADRIRHGIRAVEDSGLVREIAGRGLVLDVCPLSNLRTGAVATLDDHPLPTLLDAGVRARSRPTTPPCSTPISPRLRGGVHAGATRRGVFYEAGVAGALCDEATRDRLRAIGEAYDSHALDLPGTTAPADLFSDWADRSDAALLAVGAIAAEARDSEHGHRSRGCGGVRRLSAPRRGAALACACGETTGGPDSTAPAFAITVDVQHVASGITSRGWMRRTA